MEKIYMEDFSKKKSKTILKGRGILITSMLMVIVAVAAFVTAGFNNVSYAVDPSQLGETFISAEPGESVASSTNGKFQVEPLYVKYGSVDVQVYCLENSVPFVGNTSYSMSVSGGEPVRVEDYGLLWLVANGEDFLDAKFDTTDLEGNVNEETERKYYAAAQTWVMQTAIWSYQYIFLNASLDNAANIVSSKNGLSSTFVSHDTLVLDDDLEKVIKMTSGPNTVDFSSYVKDLVMEARKHLAPSGDVAFVLDSDKVKEEGDYLIVGPVRFTSESELSSYTISITNSIKGAELIDESGKKLADTNPAQKFYVKVPKSSVTKEGIKVNIGAAGKVSSLGGYVYEGVIPAQSSTGVAYSNAGSPAQKITAVQPVTFDVTAAISIPLKYEVEVPDTGMTTAHTIYFIGLVVLLCGVGIVYANVKPKEAE